MRRSLKTAFVPLLVLLAALPAFSQNFVALKGNKVFSYETGMPLRIVLSNDSVKKVKGYFVGADAFGVYLEPFKAKDTGRVYVPLNQIQSVARLNRKSRKVLGYVYAAGGLLTGILLVAAKPSILSPMGYVVFIPVAVGAAAVLYGMPATYLGEWVGKKSLQRGWAFGVQ